LILGEPHFLFAQIQSSLGNGHRPRIRLTGLSGIETWESSLIEVFDPDGTAPATDGFILRK
jgi:hypothetical protein